VAALGEAAHSLPPGTSILAPLVSASSDSSSGSGEDAQGQDLHASTEPAESTMVGQGSAAGVCWGESVFIKYPS
jgi:hypothetical protein